MRKCTAEWLGIHSLSPSCPLFWFKTRNQSRVLNTKTLCTVSWQCDNIVKNTKMIKTYCINLAICMFPKFIFYFISFNFLSRYISIRQLSLHKYFLLFLSQCLEPTRIAQVEWRKKTLITDQFCWWCYMHKERPTENQFYCFIEWDDGVAWK